MQRAKRSGCLLMLFVLFRQFVDGSLQSQPRHAESPKTKRSAGTKAAPGAPATGLTEQHLADAPLRERGPSTASVDTRARKAQGCSFPGSSDLTLRVVQSVTVVAFSCDC